MNQLDRRKMFTSIEIYLFVYIYINNIKPKYMYVNMNVKNILCRLWVYVILFLCSVTS